MRQKGTFWDTVQGALFLTDWLLVNMTGLGFKGKRIFELGCGVGFLGLHILKAIQLESYTFTDVHPVVLNTAWFNIGINSGEHVDGDLHRYTCQGPPLRTEAFPWVRHLQDGSRITVDELNWTSYTADKLDEVDVILGADIVYERSLIAPLCSVLSALFEKNPKAVAFIACTERSSTTLKCFQEEMEKKKLCYTVTARGSYTPSENLLCSDVLHQRTCIYKVSM